jgi:hypothetical protein
MWNLYSFNAFLFLKHDSYQFNVKHAKQNCFTSPTKFEIFQDLFKLSTCLFFMILVAKRTIYLHGISEVFAK